ncbi:hypothetical protein AMTRI_Chr03g43580 [Amborella trichopoda]|uniref:pentatricopeptide repeat-containing protein At4g38150 n=1 Tax=Amborella trichopoda TaxID=13333 RepID=UPI0005D37884|nr:pentatricopeptide repeat-containing protein At4g38150 [Amborella trichopoda]|eukprot:XP_011625490.1 pentatricopeptide repeat-containing protein At4g38150 [Amborella trichopoda]
MRSRNFNRLLISAHEFLLPPEATFSFLWQRVIPFPHSSLSTPLPSSPHSLSSHTNFSTLSRAPSPLSLSSPSPPSPHSPSNYTNLSTIPNRPLRGNPIENSEEAINKFELDDNGNMVRTRARGEEAINKDLPLAETPKLEELKQEQTQDSEEIFKKMKETGMIPNAVAMLDGLCKDGLVQEAMKLFGTMREKGTIPEIVIYTAVVDAFCKSGKFEDAIRVFRKMQKNGITPNAYSYTMIIQGLCKGGLLEDGAKICLEMVESGWSPNVQTFVMLVDGFCKENMIEDVEKLIAGLREKGYATDERVVREYLDKKGSFSRKVWEVIFGNRKHQRKI